MPALITWWTQDLALLAPGAKPDRVAASGAELLQRWTTTERHYHGTRHLVECFWAGEELAAAGELTDEEGALARIAWWFHDAVQDPTAAPGANEAASAALAADLLSSLGVAEEHVDQVERCVQLTAAHEGARSRLERAVVDGDLWIFAAEPERYDDYVTAIRAEYAFIPDDAFRAGRAAVVHRYLDRRELYATDHARREWTGPARANLTRELESLS